MKYALDVPEAVLDAITREHTAFGGFHELLTAEGNYRPTIDVRNPVLALLADAYDLAQAVRIDSRRAYRYGGTL